MNRSESLHTRQITVIPAGHLPAKLSQNLVIIQTPAAWKAFAQEFAKVTQAPTFDAKQKIYVINNAYATFGIASDANRRIGFFLEQSQVTKQYTAQLRGCERLSAYQHDYFQEIQIDEFDIDTVSCEGFKRFISRLSIATEKALIGKPLSAFEVLRNRASYQFEPQTIVFDFSMLTPSDQLMVGTSSQQAPSTNLSFRAPELVTTDDFEQSLSGELSVKVK